MKKILEVLGKFLVVVLAFALLFALGALGKVAEGYLLGTGFELREQAK